MLGDNSSYEAGRTTRHMLEESGTSPYISGLELSMDSSRVDHGPELSPAERCSDLCQPQSPMSRMEKTGLGITENSMVTFVTGDPNATAQAPRSWKWRFWLLAIAVAVVTMSLAIALPLSLILPRKRSSVGLSVPTTGAFNGTGMALLQLGTSKDDYIYHLYYQHATGEIRDLELNNYEWVAASYTNVGLPATVKNGTPMAVATYAVDPKSQPIYHIFYIDSSGTLQETINSGGASNWNRGSLGALNIQPSESKSVGLAACSNERWNGQNTTVNERVFELYYGGSDNLVHELIFNFGSQAWTSHKPFPGSTGNSGIACSASNTSLSYVFLSNTEDKLELWWKDSNDTNANSAKNTTAHPLGGWRKVLDPAPITIQPNSSISRIRTGDTNNLIFFQDPTRAIKALQPVLSADTSTWGSLIDVGSAVAGPGSQMAALNMFDGNFSTMGNLTQTENDLNHGFRVYFQNNGSDITEFARNYNEGQWTSDTLPAL